MKNLKINYGLTLVELVISIGISSIIFLAVFFFITKGLTEIDVSNSKTKIVDQVFSFKNELNKFIRGGYNIYSKVGNGKNSILLLKNIENNKGLLIGVVDREIMKFQLDYVYKDNVIGYRLLSGQEVLDIVADESKIYSLNIQKDKIFDLIMVKDFNVEFYNSDEIIDLYLSTFIYKNSEQFGKSLTGFYMNYDDLLEFNFNF